jgi:hypothetical protein
MPESSNHAVSIQQWTYWISLDDLVASVYLVLCRVQTQDKKPPTLLRFAKAFSGHYLAICSGGLSIPFAALAAFLSNPPIKLLFIGLSALGFLIASYSVWARERRDLCSLQIRVNQLDEEMKPKPELYLGHHTLPEFSQLKPGLGVSNRGTTAFNIRFSAISGRGIVMQFNPLEYIHNAELHALFFVITKDGEVIGADDDHLRQIIVLFSEAYKQLEITLPLSISYVDNRRRRFVTMYDIVFNRGSLACTLIFKGHSSAE